MNRNPILLTVVCLVCPAGAVAQASPAQAAWNALVAPVFDPAKSANIENVVIVRDRVTITLTDGGIHFTQPANGVVFGAVFHGNGRVQVTPPSPIEAQQLRLFTKQDKLDMAFTEATFSFTDGLLEEVAKQVRWQPSGWEPWESPSRRSSSNSSSRERWTAFPSTTRRTCWPS